MILLILSQLYSVFKISCFFIDLNYFFFITKDNNDLGLRFFL